VDTNKKTETKSSSMDDIDKKIHANQVLYDQLHQSLVDEIVSKDDKDQKKEKSRKPDVSSTRNFLLNFLIIINLMNYLDMLFGGLQLYSFQLQS